MICKPRLVYIKWRSDNLIVALLGKATMRSSSMIGVEIDEDVSPNRVIDSVKESLSSGSA